ncbi:MAG: cell wall-active antibiotics response protein [Gemmatimonadaceae bacterium]|nr:cell wall-active antibiotics response protein [Gemmatimonadaceae bacterium]
MIALRRMALALVGTVTPLVAQDWQTLDAQRQAGGDTRPLAVRVEYAAGRLELKTAEAGTLYRARLRYDADRTDPVHRFDVDSRSLTIGVRSEGRRIHREDDAGSLRLELARGIPIDLTANIGAVEGELEFGGLSLTALALRTGASDLAVRVSSPNPIALTSATIDVGAAGAKFREFGNARAERIRANVGVGTLDLDLSGEWTGTIDLSATIALGGLTLRIPDDAGVEIDATSFLASFDKQGLEKDGGVWRSRNWSRATRKVRARITATLGSVDLRYTGR